MVIEVVRGTPDGTQLLLLVLCLGFTVLGGPYVVLGIKLESVHVRPVPSLTPILSLQSNFYALMYKVTALSLPPRCTRASPTVLFMVIYIKQIYHCIYIFIVPILFSFTCSATISSHHQTCLVSRYSIHEWDDKVSFFPTHLT